MPTPTIHTFTLSPHPVTRTKAVRRIGGRLSRVPGGLLVSYVLEGDLARIRAPGTGRPRFTDELWRHTCFEVFVTGRGRPGYYEFNFSPSGEWAVYAFADYRERMASAAALDVEALSPAITVGRAADKLELDAVVRLDRLAPLVAGPLALGLSAVVEAEDNALSYWALAHPLDKPDFHHPQAFALELDEVRD